MRLQGVMQPLKDNMKFKSITEKISEKTFPINIYGISESGKSYIINGIFEENDNSMVVVTHSDVDAKNLYEDLKVNRFVNIKQNHLNLLLKNKKR